MKTHPKTTIDYLRFRSQAEPLAVLDALKPMYGVNAEHLGLKHLDHGALGFQQAAQIVFADMVIGRMDYGGASQRGWVRTEVAGKGCGWVEDWEAVEGIELLPSSEVRRLDIALTTWDGEVTHDRVVAAHASGSFKTCGRPPYLRQITSSNPRAGRTCYVGERKSAKFFRAYEKGYEMLAGTRHADTCTHIDGKAVEDIYRCEVELKADGAPIGWDVIERRDQYFAGSYPFCADVLPGVEADILMRRKERDPQRQLAQALENCRLQFGPTLYTALRAYRGDIGAVWDKVIGDHHSVPLIEAGVLLVDHDD
jgi:DNA relaxase NicK